MAPEGGEKENAPEVGPMSEFERGAGGWAAGGPGGKEKEKRKKKGWANPQRLEGIFKTFLIKKILKFFPLLKKLSFLK